MASIFAVLAVLLMATSVACVACPAGCDAANDVSDKTIVLGTENITEEGFKGYSSVGTASYVYDAVTNKGTLTLDSFEFVTSADTAIGTDIKLTKDTEIVIVVNGTNRITSGYGTTAGTNTYGIHSSTGQGLKLCLTGKGDDPTLTIATGDQSGVGVYNYGIQFDTIGIEGLTMDITVGRGVTGSTGIKCMDLTISDSLLKTNAGKSDSGSCGINTTNINLTSSEIISHAEEARDVSWGIKGDGTFEDSTITAKASKSGESIGVYGKTTLKGCTIKDVSGFTSALGPNISIESLDGILGSDSIEDPSFEKATAEKLHSYKMLRSDTVHTLTYDKNGGTGDINPSELRYSGEGFALPKCTATAPALRVFKCWSDGVNEYKAGSKYTMGGGDVTLKAVWSTTHDVIFTVDGKVVGQQTVFVGEDATRPADPSKPGYGFNGWFTDRGELWDFGNMVTKDTVLIAKFSEIKDGMEVIDAEDVRSVEVGYDPNVETVIVKSTDGMMRIDPTGLKGTDDRLRVTLDRVTTDRWNCEAVWEVSKKAYEDCIDVTLPYDGSKGVPKVYCYPTGGEPERIDASVDKTSHTITFAIGHGSVYGLEYQSASNSPAWWILLVFLIAIALTLYVGTKRSRS